MRDYYAQLFRYTEWANRRVLAALRANPAALPEAMPLFAHVLGGEHAWLCRINDVPMRIERAEVEYDTAVGDILTHIATHGGYHRGQVAKAIGRAGGTSVNTDFMQFVREGL